MDIVYFFHVLFRKKWIILLSVLAAMGTAYIFTMHIERKYLSSTIIATGFTMNDQLYGQNSDIYGADIKFNNIIETMSSQQVVGLLSYALLLHDLNNPATAFRHAKKNKETEKLAPVDIEDAKKILQGKLSSMQLLSSYKPKEKEVIELLKSYRYDYKSLSAALIIGRIQRTDFINIDCLSESPLLSAFAVNTFYQQFQRFYGAYMSARYNANSVLMDTLLNQKKNILDEKLDALDKLKTGSNVDVMNINLDLLRQDQTQLAQEKSNLTAATLGIQAVSQQIAAMAKGEPANSSSNGEIVALKNKLDNLTAVYIAKGSNDPALEKQINDTREQYQNKIAAIPFSPAAGSKLTMEDLIQNKQQLELQQEIAKQNISSLNQSIQSLSGNVQNKASKDVTIAALQKEVDMATQDYSNAKEKYGQNLNSSKIDNNFKQVLIGQPALTPEPSKRMVILALTGASVLLITCFILLFLEYIDASIKTPSHFSRITDLKLVSMINQIKINKNNLIQIISSEAAPDERRHNTFRELLRKLRYEMITSGNKIFLFTSTKAGEGKTTLIQALAYSLHLSKKKVLIIDTNFCNNDLTVLLNATPTLEGFSVNGEGFTQERVNEILTKTDIPGMDIIGCKGGDYTPTEVLPQKSLLHYLGELSRVYDYIFLEGAPLNDFSDSRELVQFVDGVIAIFSAQSVLNETDMESIEFLKSLSGKMLGVVLNKVDTGNLDM